MSGEEFNKYWKTTYPESYPINHELKWIYPNRWFRIHSLPESKRYAESDSEYQIIFDRQNQLINDLIGEDTEIIISFGLYTDDIANDNYKQLPDFREFYKVQTIDFHKERPEEYEDEMQLDIYIKKDKWKKDSKNQMLKAIADEEIEAMFICPSKKCIVAPYDGGVDIIVDSTEKRDSLKIKCKDWLSKSKDGL